MLAHLVYDPKVPDTYHIGGRDFPHMLDLRSEEWKAYSLG